MNEAGSSMDKIVSATVILAEEDDFPGMNEEWLRWFPSDPPARQGAKLPVRVPGLKVFDRSHCRSLDATLRRHVSITRRRGACPIAFDPDRRDAFMNATVPGAQDVRPCPGEVALEVIDRHEPAVLLALEIEGVADLKCVDTWRYFDLSAL